MDDKKRKLFQLSNSDDVDSNGQMMVLFKRLHLEKTSELYEKESLGHSKVSPKRWRLSPIQEADMPSVPAKRRRIDSDMADEMNNSLWISKKHCPAEATKQTCRNDQTLINLDSNTKIEFNVRMKDVVLSMEGNFLRNKLREETLQVVEWKPHPLQFLKPPVDNDEDDMISDDRYENPMQVS